MKAPIMISIVDDNINDYEFLKKRIKLWEQKTGVSVSISYFSCGYDFIKAMTADNHPCNVVFLDIMMPETDGMKIAEIMNRDFPKVYKVLYSSAIEYSSKGYRVNAIRYLIKDSAQIEADIDECLDYIKERIREDTSEYYDVSSPRMFVPPIPINNIVSISVEGHYLLIKTIGGDEYKQRKTLKEIKAHLPQIFILCNRKTLINVRQIKKIGNHMVTMMDNTSFKITVSSSEAFLEQVSRLS